MGLMKGQESLGSAEGPIIIRNVLQPPFQSVLALNWSRISRAPLFNVHGNEVRERAKCGINAGKKLRAPGFWRSSGFAFTIQVGICVQMTAVQQNKIFSHRILIGFACWVDCLQNRKAFHVGFYLLFMIQAFLAFKRDLNSKTESSK